MIVSHCQTCGFLGLCERFYVQAMGELRQRQKEAELGARAALTRVTERVALLPSLLFLPLSSTLLSPSSSSSSSSLLFSPPPLLLSLLLSSPLLLLPSSKCRNSRSAAPPLTFAGVSTGDRETLQRIHRQVLGSVRWPGRMAGWAGWRVR